MMFTSFLAMLILPYDLSGHALPFRSSRQYTIALSTCYFHNIDIKIHIPPNLSLNSTPYPTKRRLTFRPDGTFKLTIFSDLHYGETIIRVFVFETDPQVLRGRPGCRLGS